MRLACVRRATEAHRFLARQRLGRRVFVRATRDLPLQEILFALRRRAQRLRAIRGRRRRDGRRRGAPCRRKPHIVRSGTSSASTAWMSSSAVSSPKLSPPPGRGAPRRVGRVLQGSPSWLPVQHARRLRLAVETGRAGLVGEHPLERLTLLAGDLGRSAPRLRFSSRWSRMASSSNPMTPQHHTAPLRRDVPRPPRTAATTLDADARPPSGRPSRGYSSVGRAPGSHPGLWGFESP